MLQPLNNLFGARALQEISNFVSKPGLTSLPQDGQFFSEFLQASSEAILNVQSLSTAPFLAEEQSLQAIPNPAVNVADLSSCLYMTQDAIFVFGNLTSGSSIWRPQDVTTEGSSNQQITHQTVAGYEWTFNFCKSRFANEADIPQGAKCQQNPDAFAYFEQGGNCMPQIESNGTGGYMTTSDLFQNGTSNVTGVVLEYQGGYANCPTSGTRKQKFSVEVTCDWNSSLVENGHDISDPCDMKLRYKGRGGCPIFEYSILSKFMIQYKYVFGAIFIACGLVLGFCGNRFVTILIGFIGFVAITFLGIYLTGLVIDAIWHTEVAVWTFWVILGVWCLIGVLAGYVLAKNRKWGIACMGGLAGVLVGLLVNSLFGYAQRSVVVYWLIIVGCGVALFIITYFVETFVIIVATSFIGSYAIIRGVSMYTGGFPDATQVHAIASELGQFEYLNWASYPWTFYLFFALIILVWIICSCFQWRQHKNDEFGKDE